MTEFDYTKGNSTENDFLEEGDYPSMVTKMEVATIKGVMKLITEFGVVVKGETLTRTEFIRPELWIEIFKDLLIASGQEFDEEGGKLDTDSIVGAEGMVRIVHNKGTGKHEGKTFANADRFLPKKDDKEDKEPFPEDEEKKSEEEKKA